MHHQQINASVATTCDQVVDKDTNEWSLAEHQIQPFLIQKPSYQQPPVGGGPPNRNKLS